MKWSQNLDLSLRLASETFRGEQEAFFQPARATLAALACSFSRGRETLFVLPELDHLLARLQKLLHRDRLLEEVHCTEARGLHCGFNGAVA